MGPTGRRLEELAEELEANAERLEAALVPSLHPSRAYGLKLAAKAGGPIPAAMAEHGRKPSKGQVNLWPLMSNYYIPPFLKLQEGLGGAAFHPSVRTLIALMLHAVYVDEKWYLEQNPHVAEAVAKGKTESARAHFISEGYYEGRLPFPIIVNAPWYLRQYPEVSHGLGDNRLLLAQGHFIVNGYSEGRLPFPIAVNPAPEPR